jgi:hypothetical protein
VTKFVKADRQRNSKDYGEDAQNVENDIHLPLTLPAKALPRR